MFLIISPFPKRKSMISLTILSKILLRISFLTFSPESNSAITSKSQIKRKGIHFKKNSKNNKENLIKGKQSLQ